jgi:hypothetical protein
MAVLVGNTSGALVAYDQARDNAADRLLGLQAQVGAADVMVPDHGTVLSRKLGSEIIDIDVGLNVFNDGVANGTNTLTSASGPWTKAMVGLSFTIFGHGQRQIATYVSANEIEFSGPVIAVATGLRFTQPLGLALFEDGAVDGNSLQSASAPFYSQLEGRHVSIVDLGSRMITAYVSPNEVSFDGAAVSPAQADRHFSVPVIMDRADRLLSAGGQIVDAHRTPDTAQAMTMRWRLGERRRRGGQRTVV